MVLPLLLPLAGSALSAGASLIGASMTSSSNARAARLNAIYQAQQAGEDRHQNQVNFDASQVMAREQFAESLRQAEIDRALQREFAENGVQWRVNDAKAAGIHPLAALGAQLSSPSPVQVSGSVPQAPTIQSPQISPFVGSSMGSAVASMGQDLSRAMTAVATRWERDDAIATASKALSLENQSLENQILASSLAKTLGAATGPSMPSARSTNLMDGQGNSGSRLNTNLVSEKKHEPVVGAPGAKHTEPGEITDIGYARTATGHAPVPSKDVKERIEDNLVSEMLWEARNRITQSLFQVGNTPPSHIKLKEGHVWRFNPAKQEYQQTVPLRHNGQWNVQNWWNHNMKW